MPFQLSELAFSFTGRHAEQGRELSLDALRLLGMTLAAASKHIPVQAKHKITFWSRH